MDPATIDAVSKLGFPIFCAMALGYAIWQLCQWAMRTGDRLATKFEGHVDSVSSEIQKINPRLDRIENKIDTKQGCAAAYPATRPILPQGT